MKGPARKTVAFALIIMTFVVTIGVIAGMNGLGAIKASNLSAGPMISQTDHAVYAWNGTTWVTLTAQLNGDQLTVSTPAGFAAQKIVIVQDNPTFDMHGLLNTSNFYNFVNIKTSTTATTGTNHYINMTSAYFIIGQNVNGTNMKNLGSKGWTHVALNQTLYSSTVNTLNQSTELSIFPMVESQNSYGGFVIALSDTNVNLSTTMTLTFTQEYQHPFTLDTLAIIEGAVAVMLIVDVIALFASESYHYARRHRQ